MSNGWEEGYIGHEKTMNLVRHLAPLMAPEAKFIITFLAPREAPYFQYVVSDFQMMLDESFMALFLRNYAIRTQFTFSKPTRRSSGFRFFGDE